MSELYLCRGESERPQFTSLGLVVLDDLHFPDRENLHDIIGGSGAYATVGARMTSGAASSPLVGCVVMAGDDFPGDVVTKFQSWGLDLVVHKRHGANSTRGLLEYLDSKFGRKTFRYLNPPLQPTGEDLENTNLLRSCSFHILARPEDLEERVTDVMSRRTQRNIIERPAFVWEPAPPHCTLDNCDAHLKACKQVDVFSPNHLELASLFEEQSRSDVPFSREAIEGHAEKLLNTSPEGSVNGIMIVIRAGEHGCLTISRKNKARWYPPFYDPASPKIVDATGAGNTFLGAFTIFLQKGFDLEEAAISGMVAASFALEQIGLPSLGSLDGAEAWNGVEFSARLEEYKKRLA